MSANKDNAAIVGVGVAACAVCCAGPVLGVVAAIGLGTAAGFALFGILALVVGAAMAVFIVVRRRRRAIQRTTPSDVPEAVSIELSDTRSRS